MEPAFAKASAGGGGDGGVGGDDAGAGGHDRVVAPLDRIVEVIDAVKRGDEMDAAAFRGGGGAPRRRDPRRSGDPRPARRPGPRGTGEVAFRHPLLRPAADGAVGQGDGERLFEEAEDYARADGEGRASGQHERAARAVLLGEVEACGVRDVIGELFLHRGLRRLARSGPIPAYPWVVPPDSSRGERDALSEHSPHDPCPARAR